MSGEGKMSICPICAGDVVPDPRNEGKYLCYNCKKRMPEAAIVFASETEPACDGFDDDFEDAYDDAGEDAADGSWDAEGWLAQQERGDDAHADCKPARRARGSSKPKEGRLRKVFLVLLAAVLAVAAFLGVSRCVSDQRRAEEDRLWLEQYEREHSGNAVNENAPDTQSKKKEILKGISGTWKFAGMEKEGAFILGDGALSSMAGITAQGETFADALLTVGADGTGEMKIAGVTAKISSCEMKDAETMVLKFSGQEGEASYEVEMEDGAVKLGMDTDGQYGFLVFTKDGSYKGYEPISPSDMTAITREDAIVGEWEISAIEVFGLSTFGDAESLSGVTGSLDKNRVSFEADGRCLVGEEQLRYAAEPDGITIYRDQQISVGNIAVEPLSGERAYASVKALGDRIALDFSENMGVEEFYVYSRVG